MSWIYEGESQDPHASLIELSSDEEVEDTLPATQAEPMSEFEEEDEVLVSAAQLAEKEQELDVLRHVKKYVYLEGTCCTGKTTMAGERAGREVSSMDFLAICYRYPVMRQKVTNVYLDMLYASVTSFLNVLHPNTETWDRAPWSGLVYKFMHDEGAHKICGYQPDWKTPTERQHKFTLAVSAMRDMCQSNGLQQNWLDVVILINTDLAFAVKLMLARGNTIDMAMENISHYVNAQNVIFRHVAVLLGPAPIVDMAKYKVGDQEVNWEAYAEEVSDAIDLVVAHKMQPRGCVAAAALEEYKESTD